MGPVAPLAAGQRALVRGFEDPLLHLLGQLPEIPLTVALATDDPALDEDPFFLRGQRWVEVPPERERDVSAVGVRWNGDKTQIALPGATRALEIAAALRPLGVAGEYAFFAALDEDTFASPLANDHGEGVFVVRVVDLANGAARRTSVPVFFFPLPGEGWTHERVALAHWEARDALTLLDGRGVPLPIALEDVDTVVDAERLNLTLAVGLAARARARGRDLLASPVLPLAKSTAGFGMLFTGFDVEAGDFLFDEAPLHAGGWARARELLHAAVDGFTIGNARADATDEATAAANKLYDSLTRVGVVLAVSSIAAVVLKYSVFAEHFAKRHAAEDEKNGGSPGWLGKLTRESKDVGTTLAHNLTVLSNFASIWFGHGVQYTVDRFFPALGSGKNQRLNRFLDATVYFTKKTGEKLPVNYRTLLLGALVLGGVDSVLVAAQLYFVVPWMAQAYAQAVPGSAAKVNEIFQLGNPMTEVYNRNESIRNFASYLASGASSFSAQLRGQLMSVYGPAVDEEMRKEGFDPLDSRNKDEREDRIGKRLGQVFHQLGLPGEEDFLFDASTLWNGGLGLLGYSAPETEVSGGKDKTKYVGQQHPGLVLSALKRALREAKRREALAPSDASLVAARKLLESTLSDASKLRQLSLGGLRTLGAAVTQSLGAVKTAVTKPLSSAWQAVRHPLKSLGRFFGPIGQEVADTATVLRSTRQKLFALTYDGPLGQDLKNLPSDWISTAGQPGAALAGHLFRRAFFGYLAGDETIVRGAPDARWLAVEKESRATAERAALDALKGRYGGRFTELTKEADGAAAVAEKELVKEHAAEYLMLAEDAIEQAWIEQEDAKKPYAPPKRSWYQKRQDLAASRAAAARFRAATAKVFDAETAAPEDLALYRKLYTEASLAGVGIYPDYEGMEELEAPIAAAAEAVTQAQLESKKIQKWLEELPAAERVDFLNTLYADNFASAYVNVVSNSVEGVAQKRYSEAHPEKRAYDPQTATKAERKLWKRVYAKAVMAPGQPGRFQWYRQNGLFAKVPVVGWLFRQLPFGGRIARGLEAFFPLEAHQKGFWSAFYRNVPGSYDFVTANKLMVRRLLTMGTATYWSVYAIWGVALPLHLWILAQATVFTVSGPWFFLNRFCRLQGLQPMSGVLAMAAYAFVGSWLTMGGTFPMLWYEKDLADLLKTLGGHGTDATQRLADAAKSCSTLLGGGGTP